MVREIEIRGGAVSFRTYMELALYHPEHGYYSAPHPRYGRSGDYLTAPTASRWYASVMAWWLDRIARLAGPVAVADIASGDGSFLGGFLAAATPGVVERAVAVEQSAALRRLQGGRRAPPPRPELHDSLDRAGRPRGTAVLHMSELYDALPTHRVVGRGADVLELWVTVRGAELSWEERPASPEIDAYVARHHVELADGQIAELCLDAEPLHRRCLSWAGARGVAVILDYGYPADRLYRPLGRMGGSLACYRDHRLSRDPLASPGKQDITAHVNWDDLRHAADAVGWRETGLWPLAEFLVRAGLPELVEERGIGIARELDTESYRERQEIKRILDPDGMGSDLKVLVQAAPDLMDAVTKTLTGPR